MGRTPEIEADLRSCRQDTPKNQPYIIIAVRSERQVACQETTTKGCVLCPN